MGYITFLKHMYKIVSCTQQCFYEEKNSNTTLVNTIPNGFNSTE